MKISLKPLPFSYSALEPYISRETIKTHYMGHHAGYVKKFNEMIATNGYNTAELNFNYNGHLLHEMYWESLGLDTKIGPKLMRLITNQFGSIPIFIEKLTKACASHMGSGWTLLIQHPTKGLVFQNIPNHELDRVESCCNILLVIDAWEHAYYLDYKNDKKKFFDMMLWTINWNAAEDRLVQ